MVALRRYASIALLVLSGVLLAACGGGERAAAPSKPATAAAAPETAPAADTASPESSEGEAAEPSAEAAVEEPESKPGATVSHEYRILVVGADGHRREEVVKVLADVAREVRGSDYLDLTVGGKHTVSWVSGDRRVILVDFSNLEKLEAGISEGPWSGVLFVSDPARSTGNRDAFLGAANGAGIRKIVLFQVVSDLLTDMEVYDLEAQVWPDQLNNKGFAADGMATLQADVSKAAGGDSKERKAFVDLIKAIEKDLAK